MNPIDNIVRANVAMWRVLQAPADAPKAQVLKDMAEWLGKPKIITEYVCPPIPIRTSDWSAVREGYEPGDPIGMGRTEADAIDDLMDQEDARA